MIDSDVERHRCGHCGCWAVDPPRAPTAVDPGRKVPEGHCAHYHLCSECVRTLRARPSDLWGWIVPAPAPAPRPDPTPSVPARAGARPEALCPACGSNLVFGGDCARCGSAIGPRLAPPGEGA